MSQPKVKKTFCEDCGTEFEFTPHGFGRRGMVYIRIPKRCDACKKTHCARYRKERHERFLKTRISKLW